MSSRRPALSLRRKLAFAALAVAAGLGLLEGLARVGERMRPPLAVDYGLGFDARSRLFVEDPEAPGRRVTRPSKRTHFAVQSFAVDKAPGSERVAVVGGSSVNFARHALRAMAERVARDLGRPVEVINAGGLSYGTHRLVPLVEELLEYDLDALLIYSGHNEFEEAEQLRLAERTSSLERILSGSALFRTIRDAVTRLRVGALRRAREERRAGPEPPLGREWAIEIDPEDEARRMRAYRANLARMIVRAREHGVAVVLGTVPSNLRRPWAAPGERERLARIEALYAEGRTAEARELAQALLTAGRGRRQASRVENGIVRELAHELDVPLADVEAAVVDAEPHGVPGETLFLDHCHLNRAGMAILAGRFEPLLRRALE